MSIFSVVAITFSHIARPRAFKAPVAIALAVAGYVLGLITLV